jgi:hypothetical protein
MSRWLAGNLSATRRAARASFHDACCRFARPLGRFTALYYPAAQRSPANTSQKRGEQIGLDAFFNILKEFWPDVRSRPFGQ